MIISALVGGWLEMNKRRQGLLGGGNEGRRESVNTIMNKMRNKEQINMYLIVAVRSYVHVQHLIMNMTFL